MTNTNTDNGIDSHLTNLLASGDGIDSHLTNLLASGEGPFLQKQAALRYARVAAPGVPWESLSEATRLAWVKSAFVMDPNQGYIGGPRLEHQKVWSREVTVSGTEFQLAHNRELREQLLKRGHNPIVVDATITWNDGRVTQERVVTATCFPAIAPADAPDSPTCVACRESLREGEQIVEQDVDIPTLIDRVRELEQRVMDLETAQGGSYIRDYDGIGDLPIPIPIGPRRVPSAGAGVFMPGRREVARPVSARVFDNCFPAGNDHLEQIDASDLDLDDDAIRDVIGMGAPVPPQFGKYPTLDAFMERYNAIIMKHGDEMLEELDRWYAKRLKKKTKKAAKKVAKKSKKR